MLCDCALALLEGSGWRDVPQWGSFAWAWPALLQVDGPGQQLPALGRPRALLGTPHPAYVLLLTSMFSVGAEVTPAAGQPQPSQEERQDGAGQLPGCPNGSEAGQAPYSTLSF